MTEKMPSGKVRPPIPAPRVDDRVKEGRQSDLTLVFLTSYRFRDESEYTIQEFDYRLRWTLEAHNRGVKTSTSRDFKGAVRVSVQVWSRRHAQWHDVWSEWSDGDVESPYNNDRHRKIASWNLALAGLAEIATTVLL